MTRSGPLLTRTELRELRPLSVGGEPVYTNYRRLVATIKAQLDDECANFFARPELDSAGSVVTWHAACDGEVRRWVDQSSEEQTALHGTIASVTDRLADLKTELQLRESQSRAETRLSDVIDAALQSPDESTIYFVGDQPVLSVWGFTGESGGFDARALNLPKAPVTPAAAAPDDPTPAVGPARVPWWRRWWWLLALLLLILLLLALLKYCAPQDATSPSAVDPPADASERSGDVEPSTEAKDPAVIRRDTDIDVVGRRDGERDALVEGEVDGRMPGTSDDALEQSEDSSVPKPELDEPSEQLSEQEEQDTPTPPKPEIDEPALPDSPPNPPADPQDNAESEPPPSDPLTIPKDAAPDDMGFVEGKWRSGRGLTDRETGEPLKQRYEFGKDGTGEVILERADGVSCRGKASTSRTQGTGLRIVEEGAISCPDGKKYSPSVTECLRGATGRAVCRGVNPDGTTYRVEITR
ncbi:MAG: SrfA family protein [Pseudomonadota bacterium]